MTDADWLSCTTRPKAMLTAVRRRASGRKLQLLACGVCRLVWEHVPEPACKAAVAAAERFADGLLPADEFQALARAALRESDDVWPAYHRAVLAAANAVEPMPNQYLTTYQYNAGQAVRAMLAENLRASAPSVLEWARSVAHPYDPSVPAIPRKWFLAAECNLLRELFPPPSRRYTAIRTTTGRGVCLPGGQFFYPSDAAVRLAESVTLDADFARLPILADALEEADCPDAELIQHLRHGTGHARGCWAVDAVLGRS